MFAKAGRGLTLLIHLQLSSLEDMKIGAPIEIRAYLLLSPLAYACA